MSLVKQFILKPYAIILLAAVALAACNTMGGLGEDIERGGEELQEEAQ